MGSQTKTLTKSPPIALILMWTRFSSYGRTSTPMCVILSPTSLISTWARRVPFQNSSRITVATSSRECASETKEASSREPTVHMLLTLTWNEYWTATERHSKISNRIKKNIKRTYPNDRFALLFLKKYMLKFVFLQDLTYICSNKKKNKANDQGGNNREVRR